MVNKIPQSAADSIMEFDVSAQEIWSHIIGNKDCEEGWCGNWYPIKCDCGGLIHADFGDESWDGYWLYTKCDQCGGSE